MGLAVSDPLANFYLIGGDAQRSFAAENAVDRLLPTTMSKVPSRNRFETMTFPKDERDGPKMRFHRSLRRDASCMLGT